MTDTSSARIDELVDRDVVDPGGDKIGKVYDVYLDNESGQPEWLAVTSGLFGTKVSFIPLEGASLAEDEVVVAHRKDLVKDAPKVDADGELTPEETDALYTHYGRGATMSTDEGVDVDQVADHGRDPRRPATDDAMIRSEEELDVSTRSRQTGTARLRKWVETENVQMTVPIRREKARLVVEPITDPDRDVGRAGADLGQDEQEIVLSEEVVDVDKRVVAKERVRLETDVETDEVAVNEEVRKERVEMDNDDDTSR